MGHGGGQNRVPRGCWMGLEKEVAASWLHHLHEAGGTGHCRALNGGPREQDPRAATEGRAWGEARARGQPPTPCCLRADGTLGVSHLPVGDVHFAAVSPGQRESDGVAGCKHAGNVGLHHLWGVRGSWVTGTPNGSSPSPTGSLPTCPNGPTLLTGMKPRESRLMPLCLRKPVAGTAPGRTGPLCSQQPSPAHAFTARPLCVDPQRPRCLPSDLTYHL